MRTALLEPMPPMERDTTMLDEQPEQIQGRDNPIFGVLLENYGPKKDPEISPIRTFLKFIFLYKYPLYFIRFYSKSYDSNEW